MQIKVKKCLLCTLSQIKVPTDNFFCCFIFMSSFLFSKYPRQRDPGRPRTIQEDYERYLLYKVEMKTFRKFVMRSLQLQNVSFQG
jgi:hypothetical protein